jgi:Flp pilus assembly protein TadD
MEKAAIEFQLASLYKDSGDKAKNLELLKSAAADALSDANVHLEYARALREAGKTKEAVAELKNVSKMVEQNPSTPTMFGNPDDMLHQQIASEFDLNKESKLAAAERKKVKPAPGGGMGGLGGNPNIQISPTR